MSLYADLAKVSLNLLSQFGQTVTRREYISGDYDPETGTAAQTVIETPRKGAVFDFGPGITIVRGQLVQASDKQLLLDATAPALPSDHYLINGTEYTVVTLGEVNPAGLSVLYELHIRNG